VYYWLMRDHIVASLQALADAAATFHGGD